MARKRPRPDLDEVREALREHDERREEPEPPPENGERDEQDDEDGSASG
jgi:hypothetical protein